MCFNQTGDISTLNGSSLKLVDKFTYLGSSVSPTETDINTRPAKASTANDSLSVIWKSGLTEKNEAQFLPSSGRVDIAIWMDNIDANKTATTQECCEQYWTSHGGSTPQSTSCTATYHPSRKLSKLDEPDMRDTAGEVGTSSWVIYSCGPIHMDEQRQDDKLEPTYSSSVPIRDVILKTCRFQWTIRRGGERVYPCWWCDVMMMIFIVLVFCQFV